MIVLNEEQKTKIKNGELTYEQIIKEAGQEVEKEVPVTVEEKIVAKVKKDIKITNEVSDINAVIKEKKIEYRIKKEEYQDLVKNIRVNRKERKVMREEIKALRVKKKEIKKI